MGRKDQPFEGRTGAPDYLEAVRGLAVAVVGLAIEDAAGMHRPWKMCQEPTGYGSIAGAADWISDTWHSSEPGTFGFWCDLAELDAGAVREARELKRAS